jgi:hypothetical protein
MEKTYDANIALALYLEKNSFKHMCCNIEMKLMIVVRHY